MLTVQLSGRNRVGLREVPEPRPPRGGVVVQVMASGLCRSEFGAYRDGHKGESNEGHEVAGRIVDASRSRLWNRGDRVGVHAVWGCGRCRWCRTGRYTYCHEHSIMERGHSQFVVAPDHVLCRLPEECPFETGVLLAGCTFAHAFHGNVRLGTRGGEKVLVLGLGPAGLSHALMQSWIGAEVIAVDGDEARRALAKELGASHTVNPDTTDVVEAVTDLTGGGMADSAIECAGRADALKLALTCVRPAGRVLCSGEQGSVPISIGRELIRRDITLTGTWYCHYCEYPRVVECFRTGVPVHKLITHRFPLKDADTAFRIAAADQAGKVLLLPQA